MHTVAILGGGVNGLATGILLCERFPHAKISIIAELTGDETTSRGAGGLWKPFSLGDTPPADVNRWGEATFKHMLAIYHSTAASSAGMQLVDAFQLWSKPMDEPFWKSVTPLFQQLSQKELQMFPGRKWEHGWKYTTLICDSQLYLRYLNQRFHKAGGEVRRRRISDLSDLADFDVVINCMGLGAQTLFQDDKLFPVRGQVVRVKAPWIKHYYNNDGKFYVIPNLETVVLGGTTQKGSWDTSINEQDKQRILEGCCQLVPSLKHAQVVADWAGLRPARDRVRLELEYHQVQTERGGTKRIPIFHNYGHGGAGITLHWGCAQDVVKLVETYLGQQHTSRL